MSQRPSMRCLSTPRTQVVLALLTLSLCATAARAGLGPENVAVVINADSMASKAVANEFIHLRHIPPTNVVYLSLGQPTDAETIGVNAFRFRILRPVLRTLAERGLAGQIDCIAYSSDFPYAVDVRADVGGAKLPKQITTTASINGLTYLYRYVLARNRGYLSMGVNRYARRPRTRDEATLLNEPAAHLGSVGPTQGFRSLYAWGDKGQRVDTGDGPQYLLSIMLAVTQGRGTTVDEAVAYLRRSAAADGTRPAGTIYYMVNGDVRTKPRQWGYAAAADCLNAMGVAAELPEGNLPAGREDVMGVMTGTAGFDWPASGSRILPGAICEHLTSTGGVMRARGTQTPLSDFLRHGAAGASGTVTEPYAIGAKFPSPFLHYHYAQGCTLIEAFYQSIAGPYQLLIVGDPLCRPWAAIPTVTVNGLTSNQEIAGDIPLRVAVAEDPAVSMVRGFEFFLDGERIGTCAPDGEFMLAAESIDEGHHELRVVAVTGGALETRGLQIVPFRRVRTGAELRAEVVAESPIVLGDPLILQAQLDRAERIDFHHNGRLLASIDGDHGEVEIDSDRLGPGPVTIRPTGSIRQEDQSVRTVRGRAIDLRIIRPPAPATQSVPTTQNAAAPHDAEAEDERAVNEPVPVPGDSSD